MRGLTGAPGITTGDDEEHISSPVVPLLIPVIKHALTVASKESVAREVLAAVKRRIRGKPVNKKELSSLIEAVERSAYAKGYAQGKADQMKLSAALGDVNEAKLVDNTQETLELAIDASKPAKFENLRAAAEKIEENELYATRTTVSMAKAIALDYLRDASPKIIGPTEIIKNSKLKHSIRISFGTLNRAMAALVEAGDIELVEPSRWRFKDETAAAISGGSQRRKFAF